MGASVTVVSRTYAKAEYAKKIGCDRYLAMDDVESVAAAVNSLDVILDSVPTKHPIMKYHDLLDVKGCYVLLGLTEVGPIDSVEMIFKGTSIVSSLIGGIADTQELVDLCAAEKLFPEMEIIHPRYLPEIFLRLQRRTNTSAGIRYVMDTSNLPALLGTNFSTLAKK